MSKDLAYYLGLPYRIMIQPDPTGGFVASVPELPGCITQGDSMKEVLEMVEDAKKEWLVSALEDGITIPEPHVAEDAELSGELVVRMPKSLHRSLVGQAREKGVTLNQLILHRLSHGSGQESV